MNGTLNEGEFHPASHIAYAYVRDYINQNNIFILKESMASAVLAGNRLAEVCCETLRRVLEKEPVSDRYLMGLAWMLHEMENSHKNEN